MIFSSLFPRQVNVTHHERLLSALGAALAIGLVAWISGHFIDSADVPFLAASLGASTVLLLAVPHSPFSQPWALIGGNLTGALAGVTCAHLIPDAFLAAGLAMGITVLLMFYLRCLHPPGGGTAVLAVVGGPKIQALGYLFVFTPILFNALILLLAALLINRLIPHRRYPQPHPPAPAAPAVKKLGFSHADLVAALQEIDEVIDVSEDDLEDIYKRALAHGKRRHQEKAHPHP
jgi:CBS-domain-containing membrane protein